MSDRKYRRTRSKNPKNKFSAYFRRYRFELTALFLFALGIFLLIERMEIRSTIYQWIRRVMGAVLFIVYKVVDWIRYILSNFENSDIIGMILIVSSLLIVAHRYRVYLWKQYGTYRKCPECNAPVNRIHRTIPQKVFGAALMVRVLNYKCSKCDYRQPVITQKK